MALLNLAEAEIQRQTRDWNLGVILLVHVTKVSRRSHPFPGIYFPGLPADTLQGHRDRFLEQFKK